MEPKNRNDRGVVCKKTIGGYQVRVGNREFLCVPSPRLDRCPEDELHSRRPVARGYRALKHVDTVAIGDKVQFVDHGNGTGQILEILPRRNKFSRPATGPGLGIFEQVIAANVDLVVPVFSTASPIPKWGLLDRYLVAAEAAGLPSVICITKIDLLQPDAEMSRILDEYRSIGYPIHFISPVTGEGIDEFKDRLQGFVAIIVGKSGVGKTSLLNAIQPELALRVRPVTRGVKGKGRHTTTHLEMYNLDSDSAVVDTPGIREFGLWDIYADELSWCFPEMRPFEGLCRFGMDCRHDEEPGCSIRKAVMAGVISPRRYRSYSRLYEELQ